MNPYFQITYEQTEEDVAALYVYYYLKSSVHRRNRFIKTWWPLLFGIGLVLVFKGFDFHRYQWSDFLFILFVLCLLIFRKPLDQWYLKKQAKKLLKRGKNTDLTGNRTLIFIDETLVTITDSTKSETRWSAFEYLAETPLYFFLFVHVNSGIIIPKHILKTEQEVIAFRSFLQERIA